MGEFISGSGNGGTAGFGNSGISSSGALQNVNLGNGKALKDTSNAWGRSKLRLDASRSSDLYKDVSYVQPTSVSVKVKTRFK